MDRALSDIHMHEIRKTIRYPMIFSRITEMHLRLRERRIYKWNMRKEYEGNLTSDEPKLRIKRSCYLLVLSPSYPVQSNKIHRSCLI
jgi:hypothetical protein